MVYVLSMGRSWDHVYELYWPVFYLFAVLVTSVVRTRMQDMQSMMNQNQEQAPKENQNVSAGDSSVLTDETVLPESNREIAKELK